MSSPYREAGDQPVVYRECDKCGVDCVDVARCYNCVRAVVDRELLERTVEALRSSIMMSQALPNLWAR